jgi:uncharacterized protein DUF1501
MGRSIRPEMAFTRRAFLGRAATGIGTLALASLLNERVRAADGVLRQPHHAPKAKRVIFLFQSGGPSQLDLFDPKPKLNELSGKPMPESLTNGERVAQLQGQKLLCMGTRYKFAKYGQSQADLSDLMPWTAKMVDDITIIRSMQTEAINHDPAVTFFQTGNQQPGRPTMGAWLSYGLGSETRNLPAFVVLVSGVGQGQNLHARYWGSGFLPSIHQGVQFRPTGDPVLFVSNPKGIDQETRRVMLDGIREINTLKHEAIGDPEIATRIEQYEMAYRMQTSVPELMDISKEPKSVLELYGEDVHKPGTFARNCLLARRLAERGVRFIQLYHRDWDQHNNLPAELTRQCQQSDRGGFGLVQDLKQRGLLDDTIVLWSGEFGRTPMAQGSTSLENYGRDHHMKAFTAWLTGGGFKRGALIGSTDEFGYNIVEDPCHVHDLHATMLHLLGIEHTKLTYRFQGRDFRLTDVHGKLLPKLLA